MKFYNKTIPQYINKMPIVRYTNFYRFVYSKKQVQIFDLYTLQWSSKTLAQKGWNNIVDHCQVIQTESSRVFLIGGHFSPNTYSTKVSEYIPKQNLLVERAQFNLPRTNFALCSLLGFLIFSVGGQSFEDEKTVTSNQTEKYYLIDDEWDIMIPTLNAPKTGLAVSKFQNRFLYAFGGDNGKSKNNIVSEIERLDLEEEENADYKKWELLYIKKKKLTPFSFGLATLIDDSNILIMGGRQNIMGLKKTYIYNVDEDILQPFESPMNETDYFQRYGFQVSKLYDQLFILGTNYIHCWSFVLHKWIVAGEAYQQLQPYSLINMQPSD